MSQPRCHLTPTVSLGCLRFLSVTEDSVKLISCTADLHTLMAFKEPIILKKKKKKDIRLDY